MLVAAALTAGCGGSPDSPGFDRSVRVLSGGGPPDVPLRYVPEKGDPVDLRVSLGETWSFGITRQVTQSRGGTFDIETSVSDFRFDPGGSSEAGPPEAADLSGQERELLERQRGSVLTSSMVERVATDGVILDRDIRAPEESSEALMTLLAQHLELLAPVFPLEPVGDNARWAQEFGVPDLFTTGDQIAALMSVRRTSERSVDEPYRPIDLTLRIAGPTRDTDFSVFGDQFPAPRVVNVTGGGKVTIDPVRGIATGTATYKLTTEQIQLNGALTRKPIGITDPIRVTVSEG